MRWIVGGLAFLGLIIAAGILAGGPAYDVQEAKQLVAARLKDPGSARFSEIAVAKHDDGPPVAVCGSVSAKNGFGGYGEPMSWVVRGSDVYLSEGDPDFATHWSASCLRAKPI